MKLLFASTARAGRWNHKFLVPAGETRSDSELVSFVRQPDGRRVEIATHKVAQQNGREGDEMLVLVDDRLTALDPKARADVNDLLTQRLSNLERLVTKDIDWEKWPNGPPAIVPCAQLKEWQDEVDVRLNHLSTPQTRTTTSDELGKRTCRPKAGNNSAAKWCVVALLVVAGVYLGRQIIAPKKSDLTQSEAGRVHDLEQLLGLPFTEPATDGACELLAKHLETHLFGGSIAVQSRSSNAQSKQASPVRRYDSPDNGTKRPASKRTGRDRLVIVLKALGQTVGKDIDGSDSWTDTGLDAQLEKLFPRPKQELDPHGLLTLRDGDQSLLRDITPQRLWPVVERLNALVEAVRPRKLPDRANDYDKFFERVRSLELRWSTAGPTTQNGIPNRRFFVEADLVALRQISGLLEDPTAIELYREPDAKRPDAELPSPPADLLSRLRDFGEAGESRNTGLHRDKLDLLTKVFQDDIDKRAFHSLSMFVTACQETTRNQPSEKSPASLR